MKNLKPLFYLFTLLLLMSCEKEESNNHKHGNEPLQKQFSKVNLNDIPAIKYRIKADKEMYTDLLELNKSNATINYFDKIIPTNINSQIYDLETTCTIIPLG